MTLTLSACSDPAALDQTADATDAGTEPTAISAPAAVNDQGQELTLTVVDGGPVTGRLITDNRGFVVYGVVGETSDALVCDAACTPVWVPLAPDGTPVISDELDNALVAVFERPEGGEQVTYSGIPLYTWTGDREIGRTGGAGVAGIWFALSEAAGFFG